MDIKSVLDDRVIRSDLFAVNKEDALEKMTEMLQKADMLMMQPDLLQMLCKEKVWVVQGLGIMWPSPMEKVRPYRKLGSPS